MYRRNNLALVSVRYELARRGSKKRASVIFHIKDSGLALAPPAPPSLGEFKKAVVCRLGVVLLVRPDQRMGKLTRLAGRAREAFIRHVLTPRAVRQRECRRRRRLASSRRSAALLRRSKSFRTMVELGPSLPSAAAAPRPMPCALALAPRGDRTSPRRS